MEKFEKPIKNIQYEILENGCAPRKEMIVVPLDEYKDLLRCQGEVLALQNEISVLNELLNNNMRLYCTLSLHPDANL